LSRCNGHDIIKALDVGLRLNFGNVRGIHSNFEIIAAALRMGYEREYFLGTELYKSLKEWEKNNLGFKILN
jgi:hypothetical protein